MSTSEHDDKKMDSHDRVIRLEGQIDLLHYRMQINENILADIRDSLQKIVVLQEKQNSFQQDLHDLRSDFERRKEQTQPIIDATQTMHGKIWGASAVIGILLMILSYFSVDSLDRLSTVETAMSVHTSEISVLKREQNYVEDIVRRQAFSNSGNDPR